MNGFLLLAAVFTVVTAVAHSTFGELMIFRRLRRGAVVPTEDAPPLRAGHVQIVWASWHVLTFLGVAVAIVLCDAALAPDAASTTALAALAASLLLSAALVFWARRGRHPGWIGLGAAGLLTVVGAVGLT